MRLNTNFRIRQLNRLRLVVALMYLLSALIVLIGGELYISYRGSSSDAALLKKSVHKLQIERDALLPAYRKLDGNIEVKKGDRHKWLSLFAKYQGKTPESLLYDIEKYSPQGVYLTNFNYNRISGVATFSGESSINEQISSMLESFANAGDYQKVLLVSKSDMQNKNGFRFVIRVEQRNNEEDGQ